MRYLFLFIAAVLAACGGGGSLYGDPDLNYYDFAYQDKFSQPYASFDAGARLDLQARFIFQGRRGDAITHPQHVLLAFTQSMAPNPQNDAGQTLWTHGVGAFVGERGLKMELWFRDDQNGNGFADDPSNALVWGQDDGRCVRDVLGIVQSDMLCIAATDNPAGFITSAPDFVLTKGVAYVLHIRLDGVGEMRRLQAELYVEDGDTFTLVQRGMVFFRQATFLPDHSKDLRASVARTPGSSGEPEVDYVVF